MSTVKRSGNFQKVLTPVADLRIGMYVAELDIPWLESKFAMQGFVIKTQKQLEKIREVCNYVYVEQEIDSRSSMVDLSPRRSLWQRLLGIIYPSRRKASKSKPVSRHQPFSAKWIEEQRPPQKTASFTEEFTNAEVLYRDIETSLQNVMRDITKGKMIDGKLAGEVVQDCVKSMLRTPDTLLLFTQLKQHSQHVIKHSMDVCIYAIAYGRFLNLSDSELNELGLCALLHDMGKLKVPENIVNKTAEELTPGDSGLMRKHTTWGRQLLLESRGVPKIVADIAHSHHERCDGKGYPRGLTKAQIHPYARIVAIADAYDNITSNRSDAEEGCTHLDALRQLIEQSPDHLDHDLVVGFIECLGIYPPGCPVLLSNGEIGIVTEINPNFRLRPKIIIVRDKDQQLCEEKHVDLADDHYQAQIDAYTIRSVVKPDDYDIDINHYRQKGVFAGSGGA